MRHAELQEHKHLMFFLFICFGCFLYTLGLVWLFKISFLIRTLFSCLTNDTFSRLYKPLWRSCLHQRQSQFVRCQSALTNRPKRSQRQAKKKKDKIPTCTCELFKPHLSSTVFSTTNETNGNAQAVSVSNTLTLTDKIKKKTTKRKKEK